MNEKKKVGKPLKWATPAELADAINAYLETTPSEELTVTGLCLAIGASKQLLIDYENRPEFSEIVKEAKLIVEHSYEVSLRKNGRTGDIFALKNFGWKDKQEVEQTSTIVDVSETVTDEQAKKIAERIING